MGGVQVFKNCHNPTLLHGDLALDLSQYFTQWDKITQVGAHLPLIQEYLAFLSWTSFVGGAQYPADEWLQWSLCVSSVVLPRSWAPTQIPWIRAD